MTAAGTARHDAYLDVGRLFLPPTGGSVVSSHDRPLSDLEVARGGPQVWIDSPRMRAPHPRRTVDRELALLRLRIQGRRLGDAVGVLRLPARGGVADRPLRAVARRVLRDGLLVRAPHAPDEGDLLTVARAAARVRPTGPPSVGAGGGVVQFGSRLGDGEVVLRIGAAGGPADPRPAAAALTRLADTRLPVPRLVDAGSDHDVAWTVEQRLPGRPPPRVTASSLRAVADTWQHAPPTDDDPAGATLRDLRTICGAFPAATSTLGVVGEVTAVELRRSHGALRHGDLWIGNLLWSNGWLTGVIDWGSWAEDAAPGVDLLQFVATGWRHHLREPLGAVWRRAPWDHPRYLEVAGGAGVPIGPAARDRAHRRALGIAWWASEVAGTLQRFPHRADDASWVSGNIDPVVTQLGLEPLTPPA